MMKRALLIASVVASLALVPQLSIADYDAPEGAVLVQSNVDPGVIVAASPASPASYHDHSIVVASIGESGGTGAAGCDTCHDDAGIVDYNFTTSVETHGTLDHRRSRQNE